MLLFIFPKNEVDIRKECVKMHYKNLVLVIFFFSQSIKRKRSHLRGGSKAKYNISSKKKSEKISDFFRFRRFLIFFGGLFFKMCSLRPPPIPHGSHIVVFYKKYINNRKKKSNFRC